MGIRHFFLGIKRPQVEADKLSPTSAEFKNEWIYTATPPIYLDDVETDTFTFFNIHLLISLFSPLLPYLFI
jgi:hypothetical protein